MLLLIRVRYPALASVLGFLSGFAFIAYGIAAHHPAVAIFSAATTALSVYQLRKGPRSRRGATPAT